MRLGIAHHLGWAVAVTASADHEVADRRRIELIEPGLPAAPVEHETGLLSDAAAAALVGRVRASARRATVASLGSLGQLADSLGEPVSSISLRAWPLGFPDDIAVQRRTRRGPTRSGTARYSPNAPTSSGGGSTFTTLRMSRRGQPGFWPAGLTRCCTGLRPGWGRRGQRTTGSRSPPRCWRLLPRLPERAAGWRGRSAGGLVGRDVCPTSSGEGSAAAIGRCLGSLPCDCADFPSVRAHVPAIGRTCC